MPCTQTLKGIARDCEPNQGGVQEVYIANKEDVTEITELDGIVTEIAMNLEAKFKTYHFPRGTASLTKTWQIDNATGSKFVQSDLAMQFNRMDTPKRIEINALALAEAVVIVKDNNGKFWLLGQDEPVLAVSGEGGTGTAKTDRNGYGITLRDERPILPSEVNAEIIPALLG